MGVCTHTMSGACLEVRELLESFSFHRVSFWNSTSVVRLRGKSFYPVSHAVASRGSNSDHNRVPGAWKFLFSCVGMYTSACVYTHARREVFAVANLNTNAAKQKVP